MYSITITKKRPNTSVLWYDDYITSTGGQQLDEIYANHPFWTSLTPAGTDMKITNTISSDNLTKTTIRTSNYENMLQLFVSDLANTSTPYHAKTQYETNNNITVTFSEITSS